MRLMTSRSDAPALAAVVPAEMTKVVKPTRRERMRGIEPPYSAWEADVLPLNYIRTPTGRWVQGRQDSAHADIFFRRASEFAGSGR